MTAIKQAFETENVEEHLTVAENGRVIGSVTVRDSPTFENLDDVRRQQRMWDQFRLTLGSELLNVGPVVLEPRARAQ